MMVRIKELQRRWEGQERGEKEVVTRIDEVDVLILLFLLLLLFCFCCCCCCCFDFVVVVAVLRLM